MRALFKYCILNSKNPLVIVIMLVILYSTDHSVAELCSKWGEPKQVGVLDHNLINEASGLEVSAKYPGRLYHINDSGGGHFFYITDSKGGKTRKIRIEGEASRYSDFEDISIGKCSDSSCLFIGDIGDNKRSKKAVEIILVQESDDYTTIVKPIKRFKVIYPDGTHNAEGLAVHPNGDIFIITKEEDLKEFEAYPARIYRIPASKWEEFAGGVITSQYLGEINLRVINPSATAYGQVVSAFDISPDGKRFIVLTYENAVEFNFDLSGSKIPPTQQLIEGKDYQVIELAPLPQQESISYGNDGKSFIYDTEYHWFKAPIFKVDCEE